MRAGAEGRRRCGVVFTELPRSPGWYPQVTYDVSGLLSEFGGCARGTHVCTFGISVLFTAGEPCSWSVQEGLQTREAAVCAPNDCRSLLTLV